MALTVKSGPVQTGPTKLVAMTMIYVKWSEKLTKFCRSVSHRWHFWSRADDKLFCKVNRISPSVDGTKSTCKWVLNLIIADLCTGILDKFTVNQLS